MATPRPPQPPGSSKDFPKWRRLLTLAGNDKAQPWLRVEHALRERSRCAHEVRHALNVDRRAEVGLEPALARRARLRAEESLAAARAHLDPLHAACAAAPLVRRGARLLRVHGLGAAGCARSRGAVKQWRAGWLAATGGGEGGGGGGEVGAPSA